MKKKMITVLAITAAVTAGSSALAMAESNQTAQAEPLRAAVTAELADGEGADGQLKIDAVPADCKSIAVTRLESGELIGTIGEGEEAVILSVTLGDGAEITYEAAEAEE